MVYMPDYSEKGTEYTRYLIVFGSRLTCSKKKILAIPESDGESIMLRESTSGPGSDSLRLTFQYHLPQSDLPLIREVCNDFKNIELTIEDN